MRILEKEETLIAVLREIFNAWDDDKISKEDAIDQIKEVFSGDKN